MASSQGTELPDETRIARSGTSRKGSKVSQKQRWASRRASVARKSGLSLTKGTKSSVNGAPPSSRKSRAKAPPMGRAGQTFFKERTLSKADVSVRDGTVSEGHISLKTPGPEAPFLDVLKREVRFVKESSSSSEEHEGMLDEELAGVDKKGKDTEAAGIVVTPKELDDDCIEWEMEPFVMPPDEKLYHIRALLKKKRREDFVKNLSRSVTEKTTFASRAGASAGSEELRKELKAMDRRMENLLLNMKLEHPVPQTTVFHRDKENMHEYIAKKRELFLVQMSLDTKRAEIRKLDERTFQREEALRKSEEMLEKDRLEFDAFLGKNDEKTQEALKRAEKYTKLKQDKILEIKKLNTETGTVRAEVSMYEGQLEECNRCKEFLVKLTPIDWLEKQAISKAKGDAQRRTVAQGGADSEEEDEVTYFLHPQQLLDIYSAMEASNLALLQHTQAIEGMLGSLKTKMREARATNDAEINSLKSQLSVLQDQVKLEDEKQATLKEKVRISVENAELEISFEMLCAKVLSTYLRCGLDPDPSLGSLRMLAMIEARLEEGLRIMRIIPQEYVSATEKAREKERRKKAREDNMAAQVVEMEERRKRTVELARAPIFKRIGKPPMPRSFLPKRKKKQGGGDIKTIELKVKLRP